MSSVYQAPLTFQVPNLLGTFVLGPHFPAEIPTSLLGLPFSWDPGTAVFTYDSAVLTPAQVQQLQATVMAHDPRVVAVSAAPNASAAFQTASTTLQNDGTVAASIKAWVTALRNQLNI